MGREIRVGIITGLIASSIFMVAIKPLMAVFGHAIGLFGPRFAAWIMGPMYRSAAIGTAQWLPLIFELSILLGFSYGGIVIVLLSEARRRKLANDPNDRHSTGPFGRLGWIVVVSRRLVKVAVPIVGLLLTLLSIWAFGEVQVTGAFHQRLAVLRPVISEQQEAVYLAQWALMSSREDYLALSVDMDKRAAEQGVRLPPVPAP